MSRRFQSGGSLYCGRTVVAVMGTAGAVSMAMGTLNYGLFIKPMGDAGAPIAGYVHESTGSFNLVWWVGVGLMTGAAVLVVLTGAPRKPGGPRAGHLVASRFDV